MRKRISDRNLHQEEDHGARLRLARDLLKLSHRAHGFGFLPRQPVHSLLTGRHASRLRGRGLDFDELRHYYEGDDTRTIDWAATVRLGTPYVRVYREERDRSVMLLVDQRCRCSSTAGAPPSRSSRRRSRRSQRSASPRSAIGSEASCSPSRAFPRWHLRPARAACDVCWAKLARHNSALRADAPHPADPSLFDEALRRAARFARHDCLIVTISDGSGKTAETTRLVTDLTAHNDVIAVFVYDPLEAELPDIGRAVLAEGEHQVEVDLSGAELRRRFAAQFAEGRAAVGGFSLTREIPVLPIRTDLDVTAQLRALIGQRMARAA